MWYHKKGSMEMRKAELVKVLAEGSKSFKQLVETGIFGKNRRDLSVCLKQLEAKGVVVKLKKSHKNVQYLLSDSILGRLLTEDKKEYEAMINAMKDISLSNLESEDAKKSIEAIILRGLRDYLEGVEAVVRSPRAFRHYARVLLLDRFTDRFSRILVTCGHKYPNETDLAINNVKRKLR